MLEQFRSSFIPFTDGMRSWALSDAPLTIVSVCFVVFLSCGYICRIW